jgi:hypothetical protein
MDLHSVSIGARRAGACVASEVREDAHVAEEGDQPRPRHQLQLQARLAELDAVALDISDHESLADHVVEPYAAHGQLAAGLTRVEADVCQDFVLDERQRPAGRRPRRLELAVALQPLPGARLHRRHGLERRLS